MNKLVLKLKDDNGKNKTITIKNVKEDIEDEVVEDFFEILKENQILVLKDGGNLDEIVSANLVNEKVTPLI